MTKEIITQDYVKQLFEYRDGELFWKVKHSRSVLIGKKVGTKTKRGYFQLTINKKMYLTHRIIFLMHHGYLPKYLDHIDGNPSNNKIENLRAATLNQNQYNTKLNKNNNSGYKGVSWCESTNNWRVRIQVNKVSKLIGYFDDLELAGLVAQETRNKYHGEFANHG